MPVKTIRSILVANRGEPVMRAVKTCREMGIAVTLRQNYGGRLIHANLKTLGPPREALICEGARVGVMGAKGAVGVLHGKKLAHLEDDEARFKEETVLTRQYETDKLNPEQMIALGYAERIVPSDALREEIDGLLRQMIDARKDK